MKATDIIVSILLVIGGLNWGLVGIFDFNLVNAVFGEMTFLSRLIYILVGLSAVYDLLMVKAISTRWDLHLKKPAHA